jgi:hypothetical protein
MFLTKTLLMSLTEARRASLIVSIARTAEITKTCDGMRTRSISITPKSTSPTYIV